MVDRYYRGQGKVFIATRSTAGVPQGFRYLGNIPELKLSTEVQKIEHKESYTGKGKVDLILETEQKAMVSMKLEDLTSDNLAFALYGTKTTVASATVTDEPIPYFGKGKYYNTANINLSNVVLSRLTANLVLGTDYTIDAATGTFYLIPGSTVAWADGDNILADYTSSAIEKVTAFTATNRNYWLRFNGLNTVEDKPVVIDVFQARFDPQKVLDLISTELSSAELDGQAIYDDFQSADGGYFRVRQTVLA